MHLPPMKLACKPAGSPVAVQPVIVALPGLVSVTSAGVIAWLIVPVISGAVTVGATAQPLSSTCASAAVPGHLSVRSGTPSPSASAAGVTATFALTCLVPPPFG